MLPRLPSDLTIRLDPLTIDLEGNNLPAVACRACGTDLTIHQPEPEFPEALLGTCSSCGAWHFVGLATTGEEAIYLLLPTVSLIRRALGQTGSVPPPPEATDRSGGTVT